MTTRRTSSSPPRRSTNPPRRTSGRVPDGVREARRRKRHRQVIRNRIIFGAACVAILAILITLIVKLVSTIAASGKLAEASTLTFAKDGGVVFEEVVGFDTDEYDEKDLKKFVRAEIEKYNEVNGDGITLKKIKFKDNKCYIKTEYNTYSDYSKYTSYDIFSGTVEQASLDGYEFEGTFAEVAEGTKGTEMSTDVLGDYSGCYVAIVEENCDVVVPGDIVYITDESTSVTSTNSVTISQADGNTDATNRVYIIFSIKE